MPVTRQEKLSKIAPEARSDLGERLVSLFSPVLLLLLWEVLVRIKLLDARFFPAPTSIVGTFNVLLFGPQHELLVDIKDTLGRIAVGLVIGCIPGLLLGATMGLSAAVRAFLSLWWLPCSRSPK